MPTVILQLAAATPFSFEPAHVSLFILTVMIGLTVTVIRKVARRTHLVVKISGTSVMLAILTVLLLAYVVVHGAA